MNKIKNIIALLIFSVIVYACGDDNFVNNPFADIDHEALAKSDDDTLVKFLKSHYYDVNVDSVKIITSNETPLFDNITTIENLKRNDIEYKMYVYKIKEGNPVDPDFGKPEDDKGFPSVSDSIFTKYYGQRIFSGTELDFVFDSNTTSLGGWFSYERLAVRGWSYGFREFKGGYLKKSANGGVYDGPITYLEGGKGILFIPSGLAYTSINPTNQGSQLVNAILMFNIELLDFVKDTDHDNDGKPSDEEDENGDGDLTNDLNDPLRPSLPDYLNPDY